MGYHDGGSGSNEYSVSMALGMEPSETCLTPNMTGASAPKNELFKENDKFLLDDDEQKENDLDMDADEIVFIEQRQSTTRKMLCEDMRGIPENESLKTLNNSANATPSDDSKGFD